MTNAEPPMTITPARHAQITKASLAIVALAAASSAALAETYTYRLTEIGKGGPSAINKSGYVTGRIKRFPVGGRDAFLWTGTQPPTVIEESLLPDWVIFGSFGADINNKGQILVNGALSNGTEYAAFIWDGTTASLLPLPIDLTDTDASVEGHGINELGHVTGRQKDTAFVWNGFTMRLLGLGEGRDINNAGHVTGISRREERKVRAFFWDGTTFSEIGSLGGDFSVGERINGKDQITGFSSTVNGKTHAFLWDSGLMTDLGTLEGYEESQGVGINNAGQVVGFSSRSSLPDGAPCGERLDFASLGFTCGFLWEKGMMRDLNDLIDPADPLKPTTALRDAVDINGLGQIVARGLNAADNFRSYLLSPQYNLAGFSAPTKTTWPRGSTVRVAVALRDAENVRIPDSRAGLLASDCRVQVRASGAQKLNKTCMTYDTASNQFLLNWHLGTAGTGAAIIEVRVNYGAPGPLKVIKTKNITIT